MTTRPTLHDEIADILRTAGPWMTTTELAAAVNGRGLYRKGNGSAVTDFQIHGRTKNYPGMFERDGRRVRLRETTTGWDLAPGDRIKRKLLHERFGGGGQGGISPSRKSPNVFLFTDSAVGALHGYFDRWDGPVLHYTGEGQLGDQQMARGNRAVLDHVGDGRALRVFEGSAGEVEYLGEFVLDSDNPYYLASAPETDGGPIRNVIMFRLLPVGGPGQPAIGSPNAPSHLVPAEPTLSTSYRPVDDKIGVTGVRPFEVDPDVVDRGVRGHKATQTALADHVTGSGLTPQSPGAGDPGFDVGWWSGNQFYVAEVKSLTPANEDGQMRLAIGQVLDYAFQAAAGGRTVVPVVVVERQPRASRWAEICAAHGILLAWPGVLDRLTER